MTGKAQSELVGREDELGKLRTAIQKRRSLLIWGPRDAGKTSLINAAISELRAEQWHTCICWTGTASRKELLSHFIGSLFKLGDSFLQRKVRDGGANEATLNQWLCRQTSLRLRGLLFTAATQGSYRFFLDDFSPPTHSMAQLMKKIMNACRTPIYLCARGYSEKDIGGAWSLYWNDSLRLHLGPLREDSARRLLEACIRRFSLASADLDEFREAVLESSGNLPGAIVKMCELAAESKYRWGDRIKTKLVHVDYLMKSHSSSSRYPIQR